MTSTNTLLAIIKEALNNKDAIQFGHALTSLTELEPDRWITLLHLNNLIPDADTKTSQLINLLPTLMKGLQHAIVSPAFPVDGFGKLILPLLSLNVSFSSISERLEQLNVWEKPVINLIVRIVAFLEDQTHLAYDQAEKLADEKGYLDARYLLSDELPTMFGGPPTSILSGYEENCENLQLILAYSRFQFPSDFWGEITTDKSPYEDVEFSKLIALASIWRRYKDLWAKTKYFGWYPVIISEPENVAFYQPINIEEYIRFEIGSIRSQQIFSELSNYALSTRLGKYFSDTPKILGEIVESIVLPETRKPWEIDIDTITFRKAAKRTANKFHWEIILRASHYEKILESVWIGSDDNRLSWPVYWELMNALRLLATIMRLSVRKHVPSYDAESALKKIIIVEVKRLAQFLSETTEFDKETCVQFVESMTFDPSLKYIEIWDTPLIKAGDDILLFSPAIIESGSPLRAAENFIAQWNESLFDKRGEVLELELLQYLERIPEVKVQRNVKFKNSELQEIECDLVLWWEQTLVLIEAKCRKAIFNPYDAFQAKQRIEKAIKQLNVRKEAVIDSWNNFRQAAYKLQLPESTVKNIKLITVTNNPHFTGWQERDVIVTDEFCIRRFFGKAEVEAFVGEKAIATVGRIRELSHPQMKEFFFYLNDPPQVRIVREGLKVEPLQFPIAKDTDPKIAVFHMSYVPKQYELDIKDKSKETGATIKIRRNAPCPCGSGIKYKKCCGSKT